MRQLRRQKMQRLAHKGISDRTLGGLGVCRHHGLGRLRKKVPIRDNGSLGALRFCPGDRQGSASFP